MKQLILQRNLHPKTQPSYINNGQHLNYRGQILEQLGSPTMGKDNNPVFIANKIKGLIPIPHLTRNCGRYVVQTDLATNILNTHYDNEPQITKMLEDVGFSVTFVD